VAACAAAGVLALAGCELPAGVDGDLDNGWPALAAAAPFVPPPRGCDEAVLDEVTRGDHKPVDCAGRHVTEAYHLGTLTGDAATGERPELKSSAARIAYRECSRRATEFLGGPSRTSTAKIAVVWPSEDNWAGGGRWFRCDLVETDIDSAEPIRRTGSLQGALAGDAPARLGCFTPRVKGDDVGDLRPTPCNKRHTAEFAGIFTAGASQNYSALGGATRVIRGCQSAIARFTKVPDDANVKFRTGWIWFAPTRWEWDQGERSVQCFLYLHRGVKRSVRGAGTGALPIN